jgi:hypothetical protein
MKLTQNVVFLQHSVPVVSEKKRLKWKNLRTMTDARPYGLGVLMTTSNTYFSSSFHKNKTSDTIKKDFAWKS